MMKSAFTVHVHMVDVCVSIGQTSGLPLGDDFDADVGGCVGVLYIAWCWMPALVSAALIPYHRGTDNRQHHRARHHYAGSNRATSVRAANQRRRQKEVTLLSIFVQFLCDCTFVIDIFCSDLSQIATHQSMRRFARLPAASLCGDVLQDATAGRPCAFTPTRRAHRLSRTHVSYGRGVPIAARTVAVWTGLHDAGSAVRGGRVPGIQPQRNDRLCPRLGRCSQRTDQRKGKLSFTLAVCFPNT